LKYRKLPVIVDAELPKQDQYGCSHTLYNERDGRITDAEHEAVE
jgi:hypothetical protein